MRPKVYSWRWQAAAANSVDLATVEPSCLDRSRVEKPSCKRHGSFWDDRCTELEPLARQLQHSQEKATLLHRQSQSSVLRATRRHQTAELYRAAVTSSRSEHMKLRCV